MHKRATTTTTAVLLMAAPAVGQQAEQSPPPPPPPPEQREQAPPPAAGPLESADRIAQRMFFEGASLMDAQLAERSAARGGEGGAITPDVSFFAIPEPEPTVLRQHDLVTVVVREESASKTAGATDLSKSFEIDAAIRDYVNLNVSDLRLNAASSDLALRADAERGFSGDGQVDRKDSFVTRITAEVLDVKPNGTVILRASKTIINDDNEQTFTLTGTCRTEDITADNTVLSTQMHDLQLEKQTSGPVRDTTRRGFIPRLLDRINPF